MVFEIVCGILILFFFFGGADFIWFLFLDDTKPQTQEEWEDEHRKRGNISDKEWEKIQIKRGNIKQP
jgi:hypothetical protein